MYLSWKFNILNAFLSISSLELGRCQKNAFIFLFNFDFVDWNRRKFVWLALKSFRLNILLLLNSIFQLKNTLFWCTTSKKCKKTPELCSRKFDQSFPILLFVCTSSTRPGLQRPTEREKRKMMNWGKVLGSDFVFHLRQDDDETKFNIDIVCTRFLLKQIDSLLHPFVFTFSPKSFA